VNHKLLEARCELSRPQHTTKPGSAMHIASTRKRASKLRPCLGRDLPLRRERFP